MNAPADTTRRDFLWGAAAATAAASLATVAPARAIGREGPVAPSDKIALGVIGIGPRCTYDLKAMLQFPDVRCVAIADVQAKRRDAGKALVDGHYGNSDCVLLSRLPRTARPQGHRRRAHRHGRPLARRGIHPGGQGGQGRLQREAVRHHDRRLPGTGRHDAPRETRVPGRARSAAACRTFRRRSNWRIPGSSASSTRCTRRSICPTLDNTWLPARAAAAARRRRLEPLARTGGVATVQPEVRRRRLARPVGFRFRAPGCSTGAPTPSTCANGPIKADDTMPIEYEPTDKNIVCRYANGVKLIIDFLPQPFGDRSPHYITRLGTCPVRFIGDEGWVETGDEGEIVVQPESLQKELPDAHEAGPRAGCLGPLPATSSTASARAARRPPIPT